MKLFTIEEIEHVQLYNHAEFKRCLGTFGKRQFYRVTMTDLHMWSHRSPETSLYKFNHGCQVCAVVVVVVVLNQAYYVH